MPKISGIKRGYFFSIVFSLLIVFSIFTAQVLLFYPEFQLKMLAAPIAVGTIFGVLLGKILSLQKQLKREERLFHAIADEAREFSFFRDPDGHYEYISPAVEQITGYKQSDFYEDKELLDRLVVNEQRGYWINHISLIARDDHHDIEIKIIAKDGQEVWINHNCSHVYDEEDQFMGIRSVNTDITQLKKDRQEIESLATKDTLTGLPNRHQIIRQLDFLISVGTSFSVLFVDLNRFKKVNDSLGHKIGDEVLKQVAQKFHSCLDNGNFVGRLGGDEFLVILKGKTTEDDIRSSAHKLLERLEGEYAIEDYRFYIGASIGCASYPADSDNRQTLLSCADKAMYKAKSTNSDDLIFYKDIAQEFNYDDFLLEKEFRNALEKKELSVVLQPKYNSELSQVDSFEALVRWESDKGSIPPVQFIPLAEETGLIRKVSEYVIDTVFAFSKEMQEQGKHYSISINLSPIDLMRDTLLSYVDAKLKQYGVEAKAFEFEITESIFLDSSAQIEENVQGLIERGFGLALDDFGTGFSSLSYITKFPINTLKIDKHFVDSLDVDFNKNYPVLKSIISLANNLKFDVVIEGVENQKQVDILQGLGCNVMQGYFYYKPMKKQDIYKIL